MKRLTIDRSRWLRGDPDASCLLDRHGHMCCLGFYLKSCGVSDGEMLEVGEPSGLHYGPPKEAQWLVSRVSSDDFHDASVIQSTASTELVHWNDSTTENDEHREHEITRLFHRQGIDVVFVDGCEP